MDMFAEQKNARLKDFVWHRVDTCLSIFYLVRIHASKHFYLPPVELGLLGQAELRTSLRGGVDEDVSAAYGTKVGGALQPKILILEDDKRVFQFFSKVETTPFFTFFYCKPPSQPYRSADELCEAPGAW